MWNASRTISKGTVDRKEELFEQSNTYTLLKLSHPTVRTRSTGGTSAKNVKEIDSASG